jgi:cytochrome c-type biogenesis protein CcmE
MEARPPDMSWLPKSPKARRRLWVVAAVAPILALAVGLSLYAMRDSVTFFFSPSEATVGQGPGRARHPPGRSGRGGQRPARHGGEVSLRRHRQCRLDPGVYQGDLPDLFREGQGIVAQGAFLPDRSFRPPRCWPSTTRNTCRAKSPTS